MKRYIFCMSVVWISLQLCAADRTWQATGDGAWTNTGNWVGGILPGVPDTAVFNAPLSNDVAITVDDSAQSIGTLALQNETSPWSRTFLGRLMLSNVLLQDKGDARLAGEWNFFGSAVSKLGNTSGSLARLFIEDGGQLIQTNTSMLYIGNTNNAKGQLFIQDGARVTITSPTATASGLYVGRDSGSVGVCLQTGGSLQLNTAFIIGYTGYGVYELQGGSFYHPFGNNQTRYRIGMNGPGLFYLRGGTYTASSSNDDFFDIGRNTVSTSSAYGVVYADGGSATINTQVRFLSQLVGTSLGYAELTIAGSASFSVRTNASVMMGSDDKSKGAAVLNLNNGGVLHTASITQSTAAKNTAVVNFDGGVLDAAHTGDRTYFDAVDVVIYGGGATLTSSTGRLILNNTSRLRRAQGNGVSGLSLTSGGSGYVAPPRVFISGGSGSNATAVAFIDYMSGSVTGLVVTCRGEGYSAVPSVSFSNGGGSGATATALTSANIAGPLKCASVKDVMVNQLTAFDGEVNAEAGRLLLSTRNDASPGMPSVSKVCVNGGILQVGSAGSTNDCPYDDIINPAAVLALGGEKGSGSYIQPCGPVDNSHIQHFSTLQVNVGKGVIATEVTSIGEGRHAELIVSSVTRQVGGIVAIDTNTLAYMGINSGTDAFVGASTPILPGVIAGVSDFITPSPTGTWMQVQAYDDDLFGTGKNYRATPAGLNASVTSLDVNSMQLLDAGTLTLTNSGTTVVESGMIASGDGNSGFTTITGGSLTSGHNGELIVYDAHTGFERRNVSSLNTTLRIGSVIEDNGVTPVSLVAVGPADVSTMMLARGGVTTLSQTTNTYSGGTYLIDAALEAAQDRSLGAVPATLSTNIITSGMSVLRAKKNAWPLTLHENRGICIKGGCLALIGDDNGQSGEIMVIHGPISGHGALIFNHWTGGGVSSVITLTGDQSQFEGTYAVHGVLRLTDQATLSPRANLALCENNDVSSGRIGGIVEMSGLFDRAPGTGAGQVQWCEANSIYANLIGINDPAESGGFSAYGGPLTINIGGDKRTLVLDQDGFNLNVLRLQTDAATDDLVWENGIDLAGKRSISLQVARYSTTKRVFWYGPIQNSSATRRAFSKLQNGKLILCDGADVGSNLTFEVGNALQCQITNHQTMACDLRGNGPVTKWGQGTTRVTGTSTNTGEMRIYEGTWLADGSHTFAGNYAVSNNAVLGGIGSIVPNAGNSISIDGMLAPGTIAQPCGTLTLGSAEQATVLNLNGSFALDLTATSCDTVSVTGDVVASNSLAVSVTADDEHVWISRRGVQIPVLTWTGTWTGPLRFSALGIPNNWKMMVDTTEKMAYLVYVPEGTLIRVM